MTISVKSIVRAADGTVTVRCRLHSEQSADVRQYSKTHSEAVVFSFIFELYPALPEINSTISTEEYDAMENASKLTYAIKKASSILAYGANSKAMLVLKLKRRGIDTDTAHQATDYLKRHGYLNESNDIERVVDRCLAKKWGPLRIVGYLKSKGYDAGSITTAKEILSNENFPERCARLIISEYGTPPYDREAKNKMISSLLRRGYASGDINHALTIIENNSE